MSRVFNHILLHGDVNFLNHPIRNAWFVVVRWFYTVLDFFTALRYSLELTIFWGRHGKDFPDWDAHVLYRIMFLYLDRMYKNFDEHGHLVWNRHPDTKGMRQVRRVRELAKRLSENNYLDDVEYFKNRMISSRTFFDGGTISWSKDSDKRAERDKKEFFELLSKNIDHFWD